MIKDDISHYIQSMHGGMSHQEAAHITDVILDALHHTLSRGEEVTITHFGRFRIVDKAPRRVVLPSGIEKQTQSTRRVKFLPSPKLKEFINRHPPSSDPQE